MAQNNRADTYRPTTQLSGFMESRLDGFLQRVAELMVEADRAPRPDMSARHQATHNSDMAKRIAKEALLLVEDLRAGL